MKSKFAVKNTLISFVLLFAFATISCTGIPIANVPIFSEVPAEDGGVEYCYQYTASDKFGCVKPGETFYDSALMKKPEVIEDIIYMSYLTPDFSYGEIKKMLVKLCIKNKNDCYKEGDPETRAKKIELLLRRK